MILKLLLFYILLYSSTCFSFDTIRDSINNSEAAIKAQRERIKIVSQNIANEHSTSTEAGGDPYRRKIIYFKERYNPHTKSKMIQIIKYGTDKAAFKVIYDPTHPAANEQGLVKYPNVDKNLELRDAMEAERSIEANISVVETSKRIINNTLDLIR
jgi:flagellar basal-body rod protein FlgC